jgi:hypothetical protein
MRIGAGKLQPVAGCFVHLFSGSDGIRVVWKTVVLEASTTLHWPVWVFS